MKLLKRCRYLWIGLGTGRNTKRLTWKLLRGGRGRSCPVWLIFMIIIPQLYIGIWSATTYSLMGTMAKLRLEILGWQLWCSNLMHEVWLVICLVLISLVSPFNSCNNIWFCKKSVHGTSVRASHFFHHKSRLYLYAPPSLTLCVTNLGCICMMHLPTFADKQLAIRFFVFQLVVWFFRWCVFYSVCMIIIIIIFGVCARGILWNELTINCWICKQPRTKTHKQTLLTFYGIITCINWYVSGSVMWGEARSVM